MSRIILTAVSFLAISFCITLPVQSEDEIIKITITHVSPTVIKASWQIYGTITGDSIIILLDPAADGVFPVSLSTSLMEYTFSGLFPGTQYSIFVSAFVNGRNITATESRRTTGNPCDGDRCQNGGVCQLVIGLYTAYSCYCTDCYHGEHCEYGPSACNSNPCVNGGVCQLKEGSCTDYECLCPTCYSGTNCEIDNNACNTNPCPVREGFNTTCHPIGDQCSDYECKCSNKEDGCYVGKQCQTVYNPCQPNPCSRGVCLPDEVSCNHRCECPGCFTGPECQDLLDPCLDDLCQHGECVRDERSCYQYSCSCDDCYTGKYCDKLVNDSCEFFQPCRNGGTCRTVEDKCMDYQCKCPPCYEGKVCQNWKNPCDSSPCQNQGICEPLEGSCTEYNCTCPTCYKGDMCETSFDACRLMPCHNGGTCIPSEDCLAYTCKCNTWWIGPDCELNLVSILIAAQVLLVAILIAINVTVVCVRKRRKKKKMALRRRSALYRHKSMVQGRHNNGYTVDIASNGNIPKSTASPEDAGDDVLGDDVSLSSCDENEDKNKSQFAHELNQVTHEFCDNTTWHGLPNIGRSKSSASRLLWALVVLGACIGFIVQASVMVFRFFDYKVNIDMEEIAWPTLPFPAVTVCNTNKVRASALRLSNHYPFVNLMLNVKVQAYYVPCLPGDFICNNGVHCVKAYLVCDGMRNCPDGSDEFGCDYSNYVCGSDQFKCSKGGLSGVCIPSSLQCDGIPDCNEKEDEKNCGGGDARECEGFFCDGNFCHPYTDKCDYKKDCRDGSDEDGCKFRVCQEWEYTCDNKKCIPREEHCDWNDNCGDNSDEVGCQYRPCNKNEFKCDSGECIKGWKVCNSFNDCKDHSDELQNCTSLLCTDIQEQCPHWADNGECEQNPSYMMRYCPLSCKICEGKQVTPDELGNCPPDFFKCDEKSCIDDVLFCDINSDCPDGNDEFWSQCIYKDLSKTDVFEDGWWHRYSNMSKTSTPKNLYDDFLRYYYKDPGFDRVRREDPPDWNGFVTFSATPDFSDLQNVLQLNTEEINEYGHQAEDFILQCSYNERPCNYSDFKSFESKVYGNCFTFNHGEDGDLRNATKSGAQYGLKLTLFTEQHEYLGIYGQESGVRVTLHHPYEMPMPEDNGLTAKTGAATSFAIRQNIYERKGKQYSDCNSTTDPIYRNYRHSTLGCRHFCLQSRMQEYCGCMDVPFYGGGKCHILNKTQEACRQLMHYLQQNQVLPCDCWPPCEEAGFDKTTSLASWPSDSYLRQLLKSINAINPKTKRISDYESAQKNLAYIEVYYDSLSVQYVKETIAYTSDDLMSDMGGLLGLYIGVSVITICEFCVFIKSLFTLFALKLTACICVRSKHKNETDETAQADEENDVGKDGAQDMNNALEIESETL